MNEQVFWGVFLPLIAKLVLYVRYSMCTEKKKNQTDTMVDSNDGDVSYLGNIQVLCTYNVDGKIQEHNNSLCFVQLSYCKTSSIVNNFQDVSVRFPERQLKVRIRLLRTVLLKPSTILCKHSF